MRAATIALFATAVRVAAPASVQAQDISCDRGDPEVRALEFQGNHAVSSGDLAVRVTTTPSAILRRSLRVALGEKRCLNRNELPRDVLRLKAYYRERGFYSAQVDTVVQPAGRDAVRVLFRINEGKPTVLRSYRVSGLEGVADSADVMNRLQLRVGQPFNFALFKADLDSTVQRLRNAGYYRADALPAYETNNDSLLARASIVVLPDKRARFGEPQVHVTPVPGRRQEISTNTVRRILGIAPGDQYSDRAIVDAQRSLFQLGAYRHIEVSPLADSLQPPGDTIVILDVELAEDYVRRLDSEAGWATLDCGRLRLQYSDLNFAKSARRFEFTAQASKIGFGKPLENPFTRDLCTLYGRSPLASDSAFSSPFHYYVGFSIKQPRLLGTKWVPTLSLYSERRGEYLAYLRSTSVGADLSAIREVADRTQLRLGYGLEYGRTRAPPAVLCALFNRCDEVSRALIDSLATLGVASAAVVRIRTDNLISPTRGTVMRAEVRTSASSFLGTSSNLFFNKGSGDVAWFAPFGWHNVLSVRIRGGAVIGRRLSDTLLFVPPQERLYAGGATSVRGFQQNELGDVVYIARESDVRRDTLTPPFRYSVSDTVGFDRVVPAGGNALFVANVEYRVRDPFLFPNYVQYTFFVDGGDVWNRPKSPSIKWTPGLGLRILTPVAPIQVNIGYNPYPSPAGPIYFEDPFRVQPINGVPPVRPDISPLYCVSPNNSIDLVLKDGVFQPPQDSPPCPGTYHPPERKTWYRRLVLTFSIGPDF